MKLHGALFSLTKTRVKTYTVKKRAAKTKKFCKIPQTSKTIIKNYQRTRTSFQRKNLGHASLVTLTTVLFFFVVLYFAFCIYSYNFY